MTISIFKRASSIRARMNMGGGGKASAPTPPPPVAAEPAPTVDNSAEVAKQRAIEDARAARVKGLTATDLADNKEVDQTEQTKETTLLGA